MSKKGGLCASYVVCQEFTFLIFVFSVYSISSAHHPHPSQSYPAIKLRVV